MDITIKITRTKVAFAVVIALVLLIMYFIPNETGEGTATDYIYGYEYDSGMISVWLYNDNPSGGLFGYWSYSAIYSVDVNDKELMNKLIDAYEKRQLVRIQYKNIRRPYTKYASETVITDLEVLPGQLINPITQIKEQ